MQQFIIKGMVCERCIATVQHVLNDLDIYSATISLGVIDFELPVEYAMMQELENRLNTLGFDIVKNKKNKLVTDLKNLVEEVYSGDFDFPSGFRFSDHASKNLDMPYQMISNIFSASENSTIEKYVINYRISKIKEFLLYSNDTLADISFKLGFSSVAHLSRQFKDQTGLTPSFFKKLKVEKFTPKAA